MMSGVKLVATQRSELGRVRKNQLRAELVKAAPKWYGLKPQVVFKRLRTRTTTLTDQSLQPSPSRASVMIGGKEERLLTDEDVKAAIKAKQPISYDDNPALDWQWMTEKD